MKPIGASIWAIPEGYLPTWSHGPEPELESHATICILNAGDEDAQVEIEIYFADREPAGPYPVRVPARRTRHVRISDLSQPAPVPRGVDFSSVVRSDRPVVVQHTRLDSRQAENALMTTMAYAADSHGQ